MNGEVFAIDRMWNSPFDRLRANGLIQRLPYWLSAGSAPLGNSTHICPPCFMRPA